MKLLAIFIAIILCLLGVILGPAVIKGSKSAVEKNAVKLQDFTHEVSQVSGAYPAMLTGTDAVSASLRSEIVQFQQLANTNQIDLASAMAPRITSELRLLQTMGVYNEDGLRQIRDMERYFSALARVRTGLETSLSWYGTSKVIWFIFDSPEFPDFPPLSPAMEMVPMPTSVPPTIGPTVIPTNTFLPGVATFPPVILPTPQTGVPGPMGVSIPNVQTFGQFSIFFWVLCFLAVILGWIVQIAMRSNGGVRYGCFMIFWDIVAIGGGSWMLSNSWGRYTGNVAFANIVGTVFAFVGVWFALWIQHKLLNIDFIFFEKHSKESWMHR